MGLEIKHTDLYLILFYSEINVKQHICSVTVKQLFSVNIAKSNPPWNVQSPVIYLIGGSTTAYFQE